MTKSLVLKNAKIVMPSGVAEGSLRVQDGLIEDVNIGPSSVQEALNLDGDYLLPGLIDIHTDNLERHLLPRNNADWPVMAALVAHDAQLATAGITTVHSPAEMGAAIAKRLK